VRVRMKVEVSGTRNGEKWPPRGSVVELDDTEGASLCAVGLAEPVADDTVETAVPSTEDVETRQVTDDLDALREQAEQAGVKVDKRWGADKLRAEISAAGKSSK
jgi:nucleotide-binding universal stress UspA family protein